MAVLTNPMHPLYGALPVPYGSVRVTLCLLVVYRHSYAPPRCRASQWRKKHPLALYLWNDHADLVLDGVRQKGMKSGADVFF